MAKQKMTQAAPSAVATPLGALRPAPWNPRTISDERFQNLCRSIQADPEFLWRRPILAQADGTIYAGNMRYRAAEHLGMETVPAIVEDIPDRLARERALRDNAQWGAWEEDELAVLLDRLRQDGADLGLVGFDDRDLQALLRRLDEQGGLTDPDDVPELPEEPETKPGDLYLLGEHRLLCGDATNPAEVARLMNGETATLMATDPPYLVDYTGGNHPPSRYNRPETRDKHWDEYRDPESSVDFFLRFLQLGMEHLASNAPVYQWHATRRQALVEAAWQRAGLLVHQTIIWVKTRGVLTRSHYMWQHEPCFYGWSEGKQPRRKPPPNDTTVWHVSQQGEQDGIHPTQKPVELFRRPIQYHTRPGEVCYEPFLGSGTQLIAAEQLGRRCFAMELEPAYVDVAVQRWERFAGTKATKERRT
jgi:DNA modification methylase